jgi:hypothetical protein
MDVLAAVTGAPTSAPAWPTTGTIGLPPHQVNPTPSGAPPPLTPPAQQTSPPDDASSGQTGNGATNSAIGANPGLATLPATSSGGAQHVSDKTVASGVAKLFAAQEQNVAVSFQVEQDPNEIVTVFTDKTTGKVIVQFPSETLIALAKFFDHLDGSVVNKKV